MQGKIRKATLRDFKKIQELNHKLFVHDYEFDPELLVDTPFTKRNEAYYKKAITNDKYSCLVALDGKKVIGYLIGTELKKWPSRPIKTGELENMLVLKKYRGKKIGQALVDGFIKWCQKREIKTVVVWAYAKNKQAISFYKKCGFKPLSTKLEFKLKPKNKKAIKIVQDVDRAILVMRDAGKWLQEIGKKPSKWWQLKNLNRQFLLQYAKPEEFYVVLVDEKPAAAAILQSSQSAQDWQNIDKGKPQPALYIHWLCVHRQFAGQGLPRVMIDFAQKLASKDNIELLRADTNADEMKLRKIYENLGFELVTTKQEDYRRTAFYQKKVIKM